jgi:hypothetical protein
MHLAGYPPSWQGHPSDAGVLLAEWTSIDGWSGARGRRLNLSPAFL